VSLTRTSALENFCTSDASITCRQTGPIKIAGDLKDGESVFDERRSLLFKQLHVVRFYDRERKTQYIAVVIGNRNRTLAQESKNPDRKRKFHPGPQSFFRHKSGSQNLEILLYCTRLRNSEVP
jgi:hypothetical protein